MKSFRTPIVELKRQRLLKLVEEKKVKISRGRVMIIKDRCKGCGFCIEYCPQGILVRSKDINKKGYHYPEVREEPPFKVCINCNFCALVCPEFAIYSLPVEEEE